MKHINQCMLGLALVATISLSACGGGGGADAALPVVVDSDVPVNATQSARGAMDFVRTVATDESENADGLRIDTADLATSETDEADPDN